LKNVKSIQFYNRASIKNITPHEEGLEVHTLFFYTTVNCRFFPNVTYSLKRPVEVVYGEVLFDRSLIKKYAPYMKVLTTEDYDEDKRDSIIRFVENKDSFLSDDVGKWTANLPVEKVVDDYANWLTLKYPNTLFYARNTYGRFSEDWHAWKSEKVRKANKVKKFKQ